MALCRYEWVQVLSADDRLKPECLERMARRAERSADHTDRLVMLVTACNRVNAAGEPVAIMGTDHVAYRLIRSQHISDGLYDAARWLLANAAPGVPPWMFGSVAIARDTLLEIGGFRPEMGLCHDLELAMRVAAYGSVAFIGEPLLNYTVRGDSITGRLVRQHIQSGTSMVQLGAAWISALRAHEARRSVTRKERVTINAAIARAFIQRALLHRRAADGRGRGGAFVDVVRAACFSPRAVFANWRFAVALAAILAPRSVLNQATLLGHRLGIVIV